MCIRDSWILMVLLAILLVDKYVINLPDRFIRPVNGTTAWYQIPGLGTFQPLSLIHILSLFVQSYKVPDPVHFLLFIDFFYFFQLAVL